MVLARRCRGNDIYQICLAGRNQWPCPVGPRPRPTSCTPGPARRACLAVSRIRIRRARPSRRRLRTPESTSTVRDGAIPAPRRLSRVAWYPCRPWGSNPPPCRHFSPGRAVRERLKTAPDPPPAPSNGTWGAAHYYLLLQPILNPSRWIGPHVSTPRPRLTLDPGTLKLAGSNVRRGGGVARFIHLLGLRRGCVSLVACSAEKMVQSGIIAPGVESLCEWQNWRGTATEKAFSMGARGSAVRR